ncbi:MAG: Flp family type IVb pilin [Alphaproteobacteria bacterium]|jgi:pilus assembly protein Flp/PilA|nr:MAG: Flp family type IVb pilin [Alphaproteobacteria bacterium]TMK08309.1 MAG: Flp family type IVb pilin [Alphaproteobacteria bacterium]
MRSLMRSFLSDESGATATEYAMLIIFIALAIAGGATLLGNNINNLFSSIGASLSGLSP